MSRHLSAALLWLPLGAPPAFGATGRSPARRAVTTLSAIPANLTLPVALAHGLRAGRTPGTQPLAAVTTQRVLLPGNTYLPAGAHLVGTVERSTVAPDTLVLRFSSLRFRGSDIPIAVRALALANFTDVSDTADLAQGSTDRGNSNPANWTTQQVGGDEVVRSGWSGPVINTSTQTVGFADFTGVYAPPPAGSDLPRSLGAFSVSAHGLYGEAEDCILLSPATRITVTCATSHLTLHRGDGLLLQVLPTSTQTPPSTLP